MSYTCPRCGSVSRSPNDEQERYCGRCHQFEDLLHLLPPLSDGEPEKRNHLDGEPDVGYTASDRAAQEWDEEVWKR